MDRHAPFCPEAVSEFTLQGIWTPLPCAQKWCTGENLFAIAALAESLKLSFSGLEVPIRFEWDTASWASVSPFVYQ